MAQNVSSFVESVFGRCGKDSEPISPSHAVKAGRRYRYYRAPLTNAAEPKRPHLPAGEIEPAVIAAIVAVLQSPGRWADCLGLAEVPAAELAAMQARATALANSLQTHASGPRQHLRPLLQRVVVASDTLVIHLALPGWREALGWTDAATDTEGPTAPTLTVPVRFRQRGNQRKLVLVDAAHPTPRPPDAALIQALARAFTWWEQLKRNQVASVRELAEAEHVS